MNPEDLPRGWTQWHERPEDILILTYRPDVFDGEAFPSACLPTLTIKPARRRGPRGHPSSSVNQDTKWAVALTLEPDVTVERKHAQTREDAIEIGMTLAEAFSSGAFDVRSVYQVPRPAYLEKLETLLEDDP